MTLIIFLFIIWSFVVTLEFNYAFRKLNIDIPTPTLPKEDTFCKRSDEYIEHQETFRKDIDKFIEELQNAKP